MKKRLVTFVPTLSFILIFLIIGTFFDYQISSAIASVNNPVSRALTGLAIFPFSFMVAFISGTMIKIIVTKRYTKLYQNILIGIFVILSFAFSTFLFGKEMCSVLAFNISNKWFIIPIGLCASISGGITGFLLFKYINQDDFMKKIIYVSITLLIAYGFSFILKRVAPRGRFALVSLDEFKGYYRPWYNPSLTKDMIAKLEATIFKKEAAVSFPSGHSSTAILTLIMLTSSSLFFDKLKNKQIILFYIGFTYYLIVALIRLTAGAHFLSDVTFAGFTSLGVYYISNEIYLRKISKEI